MKPLYRLKWWNFRTGREGVYPQIVSYAAGMDVIRAERKRDPNVRWQMVRLNITKKPGVDSPAQPLINNRR